MVGRGGAVVVSPNPPPPSFGAGAKGEGGEKLTADEELWLEVLAIKQKIKVEYDQMFEVCRREWNSEEYVGWVPRKVDADEWDFTAC